MDAIEEIWRGEAPYILATLIRLLGSFELAEEALQSAFVAAADRWPREGVPNNPRAWLVSAGRFTMIDMLRRRARFAGLEPEITRMMEDQADMMPEPVLLEDDILRLIFICCHPVLPADAQIALCLREVCGLTTEAIAAAFLSKPSTIAQRIVRAKARIKSAAIAYQVPDKSEMALRLDAALRVIYLVFSECYSAFNGDRLVRHDLCDEAIRLARLLRKHFANPDIDGLLGLMLLQHSRRAARLDTMGDVTPLDEQDRALWNGEEIAEGENLVRTALASPPFSTYTLQSAIAAVHAATRHHPQTDWTAIIGWYDLLAIAEPGPVVDLNRAIAIGMRDGPQAGLNLVDAIIAGGDLVDYRYAILTRADFLRRLNRNDEAVDAYRIARASLPPTAEQRFIERRLAEIEARLAGFDQ